MKVTKNDSAINATYAYDTYADLFMDEFDQGSVQYVGTDATPGAQTFTDTDVGVTANTVTIAAHGFITGLKVVTTTSGTAPGGLSAGTYYIIKVDASTIKFASSAVNAMAGSPIDITTVGGVGDTQTITPAALGTCTFRIYGSNDGTNYVDTGLATGNLTSGTHSIALLVDKYYKSLRLKFVIPAGALTCLAKVYGKQY